MKLFKRYPGNPIFKPNPLNAWKALNVFNAGVVHHNGLFHMLYRAQGERTGGATTTVGQGWSRARWGWARRPGGPTSRGCVGRRDYPLGE